MKILQNETTNSTTTTSTTTTANSKEKHKPTSVSLPQHQQIVEKRKAKTLKNKILQNVAQQEQHYQQQQRQQQDQQNANSNSIQTAPSTMTDEHSKINNNNNNCNNTKTNNNTNDTNKCLAATSSASSSKQLNDSSASNLIIAEAAKILLKNGLNGTNAAAAAAVATATATLLTAAANFHQLPTVSNSVSTTKSSLNTSLSSISPTSVSDNSTFACNATTAAATAHAQLVAIGAAAAALNATNQKRATTTSTFSTSTALSSNCKTPNQSANNGLLENIGIQTTSASSPLAPTDGTLPCTQFTKPHKTINCRNTMSSTMDMSIFDYTANLNSNDNSSVATSPALSSLSPSSAINLSANNNISNNSNCQQKFSKNHIHSQPIRSDIGRPPIPQLHRQTSNVHNQENTNVSSGYGGRLQFFKDGKFILELARSKDGEKGGWVSVPRKTFRAPSAATSSTVTPSPAASTSVAAIPLSLTSSPTAVVVSASYPKNECSNSLSFSDDNSSLQSSPWQRDHCWKQAAPRKNVSKELKMFYYRPAYKKLTAQALLLSQKKRRKPYDIKTLESNQLFVGLKIRKQQQKHHLYKSEGGEKEVEIKKEIIIKAIAENQDIDKKYGVKRIKQSTEIIKKEVDDGENESNDNKEKQEQISDITIKTEESVEVDVEMTKELSTIKANLSTETKGINPPGQITDKNNEVEKINTSELADGRLKPRKEPTPQTEDVFNEKTLEEKHSILTKQGNDSIKGDEEKRLKKHEKIKTRAKLTTIVQKLFDVSKSRLAAAAQRNKTSNQGTSTISTSLTASTSSLQSISSSIGLSSAGSKNQNSKVSPPSNAAASRLVEYHQQHVSPRKRILREFEKVSLEDNTSGASGGKRSRSKGNNTSMSSNNVTSSAANAIATNKAMSLNTHNPNAGSTPKSVVSSGPTKLYSSYSIHSLLGGGLSTSTRQSPAIKKTTDTATVTSNSAIYTPFINTSFSSNKSPKSPEGISSCGGKSPSTTKSKISPPYSSPMRETPSRSPIGCVSGGYADYSGRRSPRSTPDTAHNSINKMRYTSNAGTDTTASPTNHLLQQQQHHLQQHYQHQPQTYYSPYMMSPHYVPPISGPTALSPNALSGNASTSASSSTRSPRHHQSAFRATTPTLASSTTHNIPNTQKNDSSPQRLTTASPRETTPRTVPKKTASIRRQFTSPTSNSNQNHSNCSSPTTTIDEHFTSDRRTPVNFGSTHQAHQQPQHLIQRGSPGNSNMSGSPLHPYSYLYAQPSNSGNSAHILNTAGSSHPTAAISPSSLNASAVTAAAAAAAAAASYIPAVVGSPYYHPYISTLAAMRHPQMWMQHYQSAAAAAANPALMQARHPAMLSAAAAAGAAARLSPQYHGYQYNGMGNAAALAAAAAAAAGFSSSTNPPHPSNALSQPSSMFNPMANSNLHGMQHPTAMQTAGLVPATAVLSAAVPMTDTTDLSKLSKNSFSSNTPLSTSTLGVGGNLTSTGSLGKSMYTTSNKDEQSSAANAIATNKAMSLNTHNPNAGSTPKSVVSSGPTKLYSSYSIHSLLGGGLSTSTRQSPAIKKTTDTATVTSNSAIYTPFINTSFSSNKSPKSPEGISSCGGKSPSTTTSKISSPYSSPMRETPSRSPIGCVSGGYADYSGRRSPRSTPDTAHNSINKMRYTSNAGTDTTASPTNHLLQQQQHHLQQHYQHQPQTYYSPYMMSPHYVPPISGPKYLSPNALSGNASTSASSSTRSPRHHQSAFRATTPTLASSTTHNIPNTQKNDSSPQRLTTASPRETTPRTVPKKTASIRRQFTS